MGGRLLSSPGPSRELKASTDPPSHWQHLNVLVAEDHPTYRALMGWLLQKLGLRHELFSDGRRALAAICAQPFDLIITDCQMPRMDGYRMTRAIRLLEQIKQRQRVPIIALTANLVHDDPQRCHDAGMDAWLLKPLTLEQLCEVLMHWLPGPPVVVPPASKQPLVVSAWPTRDSLIETFGSTQVVSQMLGSLLTEAWEDNALLDHARNTLDTSLMAERLHRLVGSLAFLGATELESRGSQLIEQLHSHGVLLNRSQLDAFQSDLHRYLVYLNSL
ncbi:response regulator [Pseudomonas fluorescens]|uniref:response regulator n=1 Tax=Pseudomonas fluorescens TaxID=294 RepID=UPI001BEBD1E8|nr:response regulator [Pseudomonas fluorescens]MBT2372107.1 response regulator [Pseudomonas fluorescens]